MSYLKELSDGSSWPTVQDSDKLQWKLRYNPEGITKGDLLVAASILGSYSYLVYYANRAKRELVAKELTKDFLNSKETE